MIAAVDLLDLVQEGIADLERIIDLRGGGQVQQHLGHLAVVAAQVDAADQVGRVFLVGHPARLSAGGAALRQREHRRSIGRRLDPGVRMDRDEQVRVHAAGLLHTHMQRHEVVVVARQVGAHERLAVDQRLQAPGDAQHHVFFAQAAAADGARIFAAMTRIQRDGQHALLAAARGCVPAGRPRRPRFCSGSPPGGPERSWGTDPAPAGTGSRPRA
ncbi:hypothetical protein G6F31_015996 [Rhizopus arrhizus]|nr:hypothetical protein G6F31_015996 [Rhizopus arrhizus]